VSEIEANPFLPPRAELDAGPVVEGELELASRGSRLGAVMLNSLLGLPWIIVIAVAAVVSSRGSKDFGSAGQEPGLGFIIAMALGGLYALGLMIFQAYLLSTTGQTLGKRWLKIRVVNLDGSNPGFVGAVLKREIVNGIPSAIPYVGGIYSLVDQLMIFGQEQRCLHDLIAGTRVVKVR